MKYIKYCIKSEWYNARIKFGIFMQKKYELHGGPKWTKWALWTTNELLKYMVHVERGIV